MGTANHFKEMFKGATLEADDLFLLESFQIAYLPGWMPEKEFAALLIARPEIKKFLVAKCPGITGFVNSVLEKDGSEEHQQLEACSDTVVWTIADLLVYNKCPDVYDRLPFHDWGFSEVTSIVKLEGKTVIDAGAGTGRVALEAAETAASVFAVEPVSRLRQFIRQKAGEKGLSNVFVVDGFLHELPFPDDFGDVIITSHALGWKLENELREFERVVRKPGTIIHCPGTADSPSKDDTHEALIAPPWRYEFSKYNEADGRKRKYWKHLGHQGQRG